MLDLAAKNGIDGWVETIPISEEGCKQAGKRYMFRNIIHNKTFPSSEALRLLTLLIRHSVEVTQKRC